MFVNFSIRRTEYVRVVSALKTSLLTRDGFADANSYYAWLFKGLLDEGQKSVVISFELNVWNMECELLALMPHLS